MKDRVREAAFNLLGDVDGMATIDLFAGTGALGFEALSRGAQCALFFEQHFPTAELIRRNAASLGMADRCDVVAGDTFIQFRRAVVLPELVKDRPWIVFCSPPYEFYVSRGDDMLHLVAQLWQSAPAGSGFVIEADDRCDFSFLPTTAEWDIRDYPPARVAIAWTGPVHTNSSGPESFDRS